MLPLHLLRPDLMTPQGQAFLRVRGLDPDTLQARAHGAPLLDNGKVLITHRCQHLTPTGWCDIYETRPDICRWFDCATRADCTGAAA